MLFKVLFGIGIACGLGVILLTIKAIKDGKEPPEGTKIYYSDEEEDQVDEHSPLNSEVDKVLKTLSLRKKLKKIEEEKEIL